jgi:hypothetical protein
MVGVLQPATDPYSVGDEMMVYLAEDDSDGHHLRVGNVDVNVVADLGLELFELGAGDVDPPGVTRIPGD